MEKVNILVIEDELIIADSICFALKTLGYLTEEPLISHDEAIRFLTANKVDLIILDINLKGKKDGIDIAEFINEHCGTPIIFLTSNTDIETINRAKAVQPAAYLVKPFSNPELYATIEIALSNYRRAKEKQPIPTPNTTMEEALFIKEKGLFCKVLFSEIMYLSSSHVYMEVFTKQGRKHVMRAALKKILEQLPSYFFKTHRSHIVNLNYLEGISTKHVLIGNNKVPLGRSYREELLSRVDRIF